jgi:hypothetical protein
MCNNTIKIQGHKIQFNIQGQIGCYRVTVSETVVIPPQSEIVVNGKVNDRFAILLKVGLVEPTEDFRKSDKANLLNREEIRFCYVYFLTLD